MVQVSKTVSTDGYRLVRQLPLMGTARLVRQFPLMGTARLVRQLPLMGTARLVRQLSYHFEDTAVHSTALPHAK